LVAKFFFPAKVFFTDFIFSTGYFWHALCFTK